MKDEINMTTNEAIAQQLQDTITKLTQPFKGILAADESTISIGRKFAAWGLENTVCHRYNYRFMLLTTPHLNDYVSGVILYDETFHQEYDGVPVPHYLATNGIVPGIKVDLGLKAAHVPSAITGEEVTTGLDDLKSRCVAYEEQGARFAKWRAVFHISDNQPSDAVILQNCEDLARYAKICQETGIVPIVEPEVLTQGDHNENVCYEVTERVLAQLFKSLDAHKVDLGTLILKPSMVTPGATCVHYDQQTNATLTFKLLKALVPAAVPSVMFLSGGQSDDDATLHLKLINQAGEKPWYVSFSYGRALQDCALAVWKGVEKNIEAGQDTLLQRAKLNSLAVEGK